MLSKNCQQCGKEFSKPYKCSVRNWKTRTKFCSKNCANKFKKGKPSSSPTTTFKKGQVVIVPLSSRRRGVENNKWKGGKIDFVCKICGSTFKIGLWQKNTAKTCSLACYNEYRKLPKVRIRLSDKQKEVVKNKKLEVISKSLDKLIRHSVHYRIWRETVFERDEFTCQKCEIRGGVLRADHIKPFALILFQNNIKTFDEAIACDELWKVKNGRTLCHNCHLTTKTYGRKINK